MKLSRRTLLVGGGLTVGLGVLLAVTRGGEHDLLRRVLEKHLPGVRIPDSELEHYRADLHRFGSARMRKMLPWISTFAFAYPLLGLPRVSRAKHQFEQRIVVDFILSTNFFRDPSVREGKSDIAYHGFHTEYVTCSNPFAVLT